LLAEFSEEEKCFDLCTIVLKYVQHIFPVGGRTIFWGGASVTSLCADSIVNVREFMSWSSFS